MLALDLSVELINRSSFCRFEGSSAVNLTRSCGRDNNEQCSTAQSSTAYQWGGPSDVVNDGRLDSFSHTELDQNPWWRVDFGMTKLIERGTIWNRFGGSEWRLDGFKIWIGDSPTYDGQGNTNCYTATTSAHDAYPYTHSFECTGLGRYFFVHLPKTEFLNMREVEVLGLNPAGPWSRGEQRFKDSRP